MIAYNKQFLNNLAIVKRSKQWFAHDLITIEQMSIIQDQYQADFYKPNLFVKIMLFIFTVIAISAGLGLFIYFAFEGNRYLDQSNGFAIFTSCFFAVVCIALLELFIKNKTIYRSGVDEALLYSALAFIYYAISFMVNDIETNAILFTFILFLPFIVFAAIRYIDTLTAILSILCLYAIFFLFILKLGDIAKLIMPFALMILSAVIYFFVKKQKQRDDLTAWKNSLIAIEATAMVIFYLAGNYFVIRESSIEFFNMELSAGQDIPIAFLFYILTAIVPVAYVFYGLKNKDKVSLWIGLLLVAAAVLTFKYYFSLGHPEITLTIAGIIMILAAYFSIRYLRSDKHGITFKEDPDEDNFLKTNAEALIIAQTFSQVKQPDTTNFGGGDFGGAGSGGSF